MSNQDIALAIEYIAVRDNMRRLLKRIDALEDFKPRVWWSPFDWYIRILCSRLRANVRTEWARTEAMAGDFVVVVKK